MTVLRCTPYTPEDEAGWNALVAASVNGSFLLDRRFMAYHGERFNDASLLLWRGERLLAVLPAHREGDEVFSHQGLSYGGLVLAQPLGLSDTLVLLDVACAHWRAQGARRLHYKTIPSLYHQLPCEADRYALFRRGAVLTRREALSAIGPGATQYPPGRRRQVTTATRARQPLSLSRQAGLDVAAPWAKFWHLLTEELARRHESAPVHSLHDISHLAQQFPQHIELRLAHAGDTLLAGLVLFLSPTVAHVQYMATGETGRRCAALDQLLLQAIDEARAQGRWFDFGHSNEQGGRVLNAGLAFYKESFGASTVVHDHYLLDLTHQEDADGACQ